MLFTFTLKYKDIGRMRNMKQYMTRLMKRHIKTHKDTHEERDRETPRDTKRAQQQPLRPPVRHTFFVFKRAPTGRLHFKMLLGLCQDRKQVCIVQEEETGEIQPESVTPSPMVKLKIMMTANARRSMSFPQGHQSNADHIATR